MRKFVVLILFFALFGLNGCRSLLLNIPLFGNAGQNTQNERHAWNIANGTSPKSNPEKNTVREAAGASSTKGTKPETAISNESSPETTAVEIFESLKKDAWTQHHQLSSWQREAAKAKKRFTLAADPEHVQRYRELDRLTGLNNSVGKSREFAARTDDILSSWRWYHPGLDEITSVPDGLSLNMRNTNPVIVGNAAILAGRFGVKSARGKLLETISNEKLSVPMRCAAAEAFSNLRETTVYDLGKLIEPVKDGTIEIPVGDSGGEVKKTYKKGVPQLWIELLICASEKAAPHESRCFSEALESAHPGIRQKVVQIWAERPMERIPNNIEIPAGLYRCASDPTTKTRALALLGIARWKSPETLRYLRGGLNDVMAEVRVAAIEGLGEEGSEESIKMLRELAKDITQKEKTRCAVVRAFHKAKREDEILRIGGDKSAIVRTEVAASLDICRSAKGAELARSFINDAPSVQLGMLASIEKWPLAESAPILFEALARNSRACSEAAKSILAVQWSHDVNELHYNDIKEERSKVLAGLIEKYERENGELRLAPTPGSIYRTEIKPASDSRTLDEIRASLQILSANPGFDPGKSSQTYETERLHGALREIDGLRSSLVPVLEHFVKEEHITVAEIVYMHSLPAADPIFVLLAKYAKTRSDGWTSADESNPGLQLQQRRQIVSEILANSRSEPLGFLASQRLIRLGSLEDDPVILGNIIDCIGENSGESGRRFAGTMIGNSQHPDLERRGCAFLGRFGEPEDWEWMSPVLDSGSLELQRAALKSLGKIASRVKENDPGGQSDLSDQLAHERPDVLEAIRPLLRHRHEIVQADAAIAMYHWGDPQSRAAIERIGSDRNENVRLYIARAVGELDDQRFVPMLISFLSGSGSVREAALQSLPKILGVDHGGDDRNSQKRILAWQEWYNETGGMGFVK